MRIRVMKPRQTHCEKCGWPDCPEVSEDPSWVQCPANSVIENLFDYSDAGEWRDMCDEVR